MNTSFKNFQFGKTNKVKANFIGLFSDNEKCIDGELLLSSLEKAEKRIQKVVSKINNSKKISDTIKDRLCELKLMDVMSMNMLKKNQTLSVFSKSKVIKITVFDGGKLDGDKITISSNGKLLLNNYEANKTKKHLILNLVDSKTSVIIKANNEGEIAPNTVIVELNDGTNTIRALSNLKKEEITQIDVLKQ